MDPIEQVLDLEREFWQADQDFHERHYTDDIVAVVDGRILDREEAVASIGPVPPLSDLEIEDVHVSRIDDDAIAVAYRATCQRRGRERSYAALVGSVYVNRDGPWKLAFHQHTPIPS